MGQSAEPARPAIQPPIQPASELSSQPASLEGFPTRAQTQGPEAAAAELKSECIERCVAALRRVDGVVDSRMDHHVDLAWDPAPAKKSLVGGLDYHQTLTDKVTVTESAVRVRLATAMRQPEIEAEIENKKLPRFFGGAWR